MEPPPKFTQTSHSQRLAMLWMSTKREIHPEQAEALLPHWNSSSSPKDRLEDRSNRAWWPK